MAVTTHRHTQRHTHAKFAVWVSNTASTGYGDSVSLLQSDNGEKDSQPGKAAVSTLNPQGESQHLSLSPDLHKCTEYSRTDIRPYTYHVHVYMQVCK